MRYLTVDEVIRINRVEVGEDLLADRARLESAVARPRASAFGEDAYGDVHSKAAALMHSLIRNHPFVDGNKRTALLSAVVFYGLNGWRLELGDDRAFDVPLQVAEGRMEVDALAGVLEEAAVPVGDS